MEILIKSFKHKQKSTVLMLCIICALLFTVNSCKNPELSPNEVEEEHLQQQPLTRSMELAWDYPVKPGSEEWKSLFSLENMIKACHIPDDVLKSISTKELIAVCLNYPLKVNFYAYDNLFTGLMQVSSYFNGLQELFMRDDNVQYLLEWLKEDNMEILPQRNLATLQAGALIVEHSIAETMLMHELVIANATPEQLREIAAFAANNLAMKEKWPEGYSSLSKEASAYLLCTSLQRLNGSVPADLDLFLQTGSLRSDAQINELKSLASGALNIKP